jgi:hypothetical protein
MRNIRLPFRSGLDWCAKVAIGAAILSLPFTSLPLLSRIMGGTEVAPPAIIFIFILTIGWLPVYLLRGGQVPGEMIPFLGFLVAAMIASAAGFFRLLPPYKGFTVLLAERDALITLAIGAATYLVISLWHRDLSQLRWTLRLVNLSGAIILVWSLAQLAVILLQGGQYPALMVRIHALLSVRNLDGGTFRTRVGGFTFEPSWLAHQLNMVFLPYWLAATITGYTAMKKVLHISVENVLLVAGIVIMFFSLSRIGLVAFLLTLSFGFYMLNARGIHRLRDRFKNQLSAHRGYLDRWIQVPMILALFAIYLGAIVVIIIALAHIDHRIARLLSVKTLPSDLMAFATQGDFIERVVYWSIGWNVFARNPFLGVGLGNSGFFFKQYLPITSYRLVEIMALVNQSVVLPNIKSYWVRLLAETGLVGFSLFVAWQYVLWQAGAFLRTNRSLLLRTLGWMGSFAVIAFLAEGFSVDSFALPYLWLAMGILTAASSMARRESP